MNANNIIRQAADIYGVHLDLLLSPLRAREVADCRTVICYILVKRCGLSYSETGRILGRRHSDVMYHVAKAKDWLHTPILNPRGSEAIKTMLTKKPP